MPLLYLLSLWRAFKLLVDRRVSCWAGMTNISLSTFCADPNLGNVTGKAGGIFKVTSEFYTFNPARKFQFKPLGCRWSLSSNSSDEVASSKWRISITQTKQQIQQPLYKWHSVSYRFIDCSLAKTAYLKLR